MLDSGVQRARLGGANYVRADTDNTPIVASLRIQPGGASEDNPPPPPRETPGQASIMLSLNMDNDPDPPIHVKIYRAIMCLSCLYQNRRTVGVLVGFFLLVLAVSAISSPKKNPDTDGNGSKTFSPSLRTFAPSSPTFQPSLSTFAPTLERMTNAPSSTVPPTRPPVTFTAVRFSGQPGVVSLNARAALGKAVAVSPDGSTLVVGAPDDQLQTGSTLVYLRDAATWKGKGKLNPSRIDFPGQPSAPTRVNIGQSVAVSGDGEYMITGAIWNNHGIGAAWIFNRHTPEKMLFATDIVYEGSSHFGSAVALNFAGDTAAVGANFDRDASGKCTGAVFIYTRTGTEWSQQGPKLIGLPYNGPGCRAQGSSVALSADGNTMATGAPQDNNHLGGVFVFTRSVVGEWNQQGKIITGSDYTRATVGLPLVSQGISVSLSANGNTLMMGGTMDANVGAVWFFRWDALKGEWVQMGRKIQAPDVLTEQGNSVAISGDGKRAFIGAPTLKGTGGVLICMLSPTEDSYELLEEYIIGENAVPNGGVTSQGWSVSTNSDGTVIAWGAPLEDGRNGAVYVATMV